MIDLLKDKLRNSTWLFVGLIGVGVILFLAPQQIGVLVWALTKVTLGAFLGYWIDRVLFQKSRVHEVTEEMRGMAWMRRASVVVGTMVALGLTV